MARRVAQYQAQSNLWQGLSSRPAGSSPAAMDPSLRSEIEALLQKSQQGMHVQCMGKLATLLKHHKLMYRIRIDPGFVHIHPANRDGIGICPQEVIGLLSDIGDAGWQWDEVRPVCVEAHGDAHIEAFNKQLAKHGDIPAIETGTCKYASVSCTHTNMVLRMFRAGFKHPDARFTSNGHLSMDMLKGFDKDFWDAASYGLFWDVLSKEVVQEFPELPNNFQQAMNTGSQIQRKETELQMARRTQLVTAAREPAPSYEAVRNAISRTKPACINTLPFIFKFCLNFGGQTWLMDTERACKSSTRALGPEYWDAINKEVKGCSFVRLRHAALKLGYTSPEKFVSASDMKRLFNNNMVKDLGLANDIVHKARGLMEKRKLLEDDEMHKFECAIIAVLLGKKHPEVTTASTIESAACRFVLAVTRKHGVTLTHEWDEHFEEEPPMPAASAASSEEVAAVLLAMSFIFLCTF